MSSKIQDKNIHKEGSRPCTFCKYANKLSVNLNHLRRDGKFCDIDLISGETKIRAHRVVLAASCEYFAAMFNVGLEESQKDSISLPSIPSNILPIIIDYIYTGETVIDKDTVQDLMIAADMLQLQEVVVAGEEFFQRELHPANALGIFSFAETHNCTELAEAALSHVKAHWNLVTNEEEFFKLPLPVLHTLLSSDQLKVDDEVQVLFPALKWLEYDLPTRRRHCFDVLCHVRVRLVLPQVLDDAIQTIQDPSIALALKTIRTDMNKNRGVLVPLSAEPRECERRILLVAGGTCNDNPLCSVLKFDWYKREWGELAPMHTSRIQPGVALLCGKVYAVGGEQDDHILSTAQMYDPQTGTWSHVAPMNQPRCEFALAARRGDLYAFGGWVGADMGGSIEAYDPARDVWTYVGEMPEPRFAMAVVHYEGLLYVVGGCTQTWRYTRDLLCFEPAKRAWRELAPMRHARSQAAAVVLGGHLYVIGGNSQLNTVLASVERYSFDKNTWEEMASLNEARAGCAAGAAVGVLLAAGGDGECAGERYCSRPHRPIATVEMYDVAANVWVTAPPMPRARAEAGAASL